MFRLFIILTVIFIITGLLWPLLSRIGIGHLPGDFVVKSKGFTLHLPLTTSVIFAGVVTLILRLLRVK